MREHGEVREIENVISGSAPRNCSNGQQAEGRPRFLRGEKGKK